MNFEASPRTDLRDSWRWRDSIRFGIVNGSVVVVVVVVVVVLVVNMVVGVNVVVERGLAELPASTTSKLVPNPAAIEWTRSKSPARARRWFGVLLLVLGHTPFAQSGQSATPGRRWAGDVVKMVFLSDSGAS